MEKLQQYFDKYFYYCLTAALVIFASLVTWHISTSPATWFDEGINMGIAKSFFQSGVYSLNIGSGEFVAERAFLITTNYPVLLPVALALKVFGISLLAARLPMVLYLFFFGLALFFLAKRLYGAKAALFTLLLTMTFAPVYGNGRAVLGEVPGLFFFLCSLLALSKDWKPFRLILAGLFLGLSAATKPFFLIVLPAVLVSELFQSSIKSKYFWQRTLLIFGSAVIPLLVWLKTILPTFSIAGLLSAGQYYSNSYADTNFLGLVVQNITRFFTESTPIHFLVLLVIASVGFWKAKKQGRKIQPTEIAVLVFCLINLLWYLKTPGWYRYFFTAHVLLFLFAPAAVTRFPWRKTAFVGLGLLLLFQTAHLVSSRNDSLYNDDSAAKFTSLLNGATDPTDTILAINSPSIAFLSDRSLDQHLQINPTLHFGHVDLGKKYDYLITAGSVAGIDIPNLTTELPQYSVVRESGHYQLLKRNQ